ncbi:AMP-binding protein [soil metagenome]
MPRRALSGEHTVCQGARAETETLNEEQFAWHPTDEYRQRSRLRTFFEGNGIQDYQSFLSWAVEDTGRYWDSVVKDLGLQFDPPYSAAVDFLLGTAWPEWFVDGGFNYVRSSLDRWIEAGDGEKIAIIWEGDSGEQRRLTYQELQDQTLALAAGLRSLGIEKGDRVGLFMPMIPETVVAVLALGAIGAIYIPMFSGYGPDAVASRLRDCGAKVLITADGFRRRGSIVEMKRVADEALAQAPAVERCVVFARTGEHVPWTGDRDIRWQELAEGASTLGNIEPTNANDPFMIIYTSGTTGKPKGAVHVHSGFPIKATHDLAYCFDVHRDDTVFWMTDLGWMMGPWLICGGLMLGATIVLFESTPDFPSPDRLWQVVERTGTTVLGVAPTAIRALMARGDAWVEKHDLSTLRILGSTGEPWNSGPWQWYFDKVGCGRCPIINYSGGTETGGGIAGGTTLQSIKPCGFSGPVPGMDADVFDENGQSIRGAVGELVVKQPWVGMTRGFWGDPDRYAETYWSRFPGVWVHGDWAEVDADGCWFIRGRSDDTLNVAGKRIGPSEVESATVAHPSVQEAAAIGVPDTIKGETIVVFAVLRPGAQVVDGLDQEVRQEVARQLGAALRPSAVHFVNDLPRTRNAKVMRRVIRSAFLGLPPGDVTALENPGSVDEVINARSGSKESAPA